MPVSYECCVFIGRGLCDGLITRPEESYRACGVSECDRKASIMCRLMLTIRLLRNKKIKFIVTCMVCRHRALY